MTTDLRELFDQAGRDAPAPTLDPDAVVRRARRSRRRRVWLTAAGVGVAAAAVAVVVVFAAGGLHEAGPLPPTDPSLTPSTYPLAEHPLLVDADLASWHLGSAIPEEEWVAPAPLNTCLIDPLSLGAPQALAGRYGGTTGPSANEYVLRFPDPAAAHRALLAVWAGFNSCPHPRDEPVDPPSAASYVSYPVLDEYFASQRGVPIGGLGRDSLTYKIHVAREGNVVVVIEDTGVTEDRPTSTQPLDLAMIRAIPSYLATHPAVLCSINSPLCPQDIMNAPPLGGGG